MNNKIKWAHDSRQEGGRRIKSVNEAVVKNEFMALPFVSIITVVYNGERTLKQCIASVCEQTYGHIQYIIIDGGSLDNSVDIIKSYEDKIDYWVSERDEGIYDAMNKGLLLASGDYIGMLNADDWLEPNAIDILLKAFQPGIDFVYGDVSIADADGCIDSLKTVEEPITEALPYRMPFAHQSFYVRRAVIEAVQGYDTKYRLSADLELVCRVIQHGFKGAHAGGPIATFRRGGASGGINTFLETRVIATKYGMGSIESWIRFTISIGKLALCNILPESTIIWIRRITGSPYKSIKRKRPR